MRECSVNDLPVFKYLDQNHVDNVLGGGLMFRHTESLRWIEFKRQATDLVGDKYEGVNTKRIHEQSMGNISFYNSTLTFPDPAFVCCFTSISPDSVLLSEAGFAYNGAIKFSSSSRLAHLIQYRAKLGNSRLGDLGEIRSDWITYEDHDCDEGWKVFDGVFSKELRFAGQKEFRIAFYPREHLVAETIIITCPSINRIAEEAFVDENSLCQLHPPPEMTTDEALETIRRFYPMFQRAVTEGKNIHGANATRLSKFMPEISTAYSTLEENDPKSYAKEYMRHWFLDDGPLSMWPDRISRYLREVSPTD